MDWWQAIVLGIVEGLTEYLPVSSTGHLILAQRAMGIEADEAANAYVICIQAGAILAVLGLYAARVKQMALGTLDAIGLIDAEDHEGFRLAAHVIAAFIPAAVLGTLLDDLIESYLFGLWTIVTAWLVGGVAILAVAWTRRPKSRVPRPGAEEDVGLGTRDPGLSLESMTWRMAVAIGFIQCIAMVPGTSRSLVTIVGGVLMGLSLTAAVEFSFLLGMVTLCAATAYKAKDAGPIMLAEYGWGPMIVGSLAAWLSAVAAVTWMVAYLRKHGMAIFGYYRIALAVVVAGLIVAGVLSANGAAEAEGTPTPHAEPAASAGE